MTAGTMQDAALTAAPSDAHAENEKYHAFVNLALALAAITGVELVLVYLPFHELFILWTLMVLSLFKFISVIAWFMHLIYDHLLLSLVFGAGLAIAVGTVIALLFLMGPEHVDFEAVTAF